MYQEHEKNQSYKFFHSTIYSNKFVPAICSVVVNDCRNVSLLHLLVYECLYQFKNSLHCIYIVA